MSEILQSTWLESLKQKFKDARRPLTSDATVQLMKEKHGRKGVKRPRDDEVEVTECPRYKRSKVCTESKVMSHRSVPL